jgi:hypothetical protein
MSVLVVLIHSVNFADDNTILLTMIQSADYNSIDLLGLTGIPAHVENFLSNAVGQAAVPGFFLISGYLFFKGINNYKDIGKKWKKRFKSLVIPYGAWNIIYYLVYILLGKERLSIAGLHRAVAEYSCNPVFWYVFQLILLTVLAPLFFTLLRNKILMAGSVLLYIVIVVRGADFPLVNEDALCYYFLGAVIARCFKESFETQSRRKILFGLVFIIVAWITQIFTTVGMQMFVIAPVEYQKMGFLKYWYVGGEISKMMAVMISTWPKHWLVLILSVGGQVMINVIRRLLLCLGIWFILPLNLPSAKDFMKNSFFLYAIHYPIVRIGIYMLEYMNIGYHRAEDQSFRFLVYLFSPLICVSVANMMKKILRRNAPFVWKIFSGGR